ncbi:MAG: hypothetical protein LJE87_08655 [Deltaproteobacteria bacterium]|nr:hypothetical protein [Deltaproteobacteria bacterium]
MAVLPGVLWCRPLRCTVQVRLGTNPAVPRDELPGGPHIFAVSRQQLKFPAVRPVDETCRRDLSTSSSRVAQVESLQGIFEM